MMMVVYNSIMWDHCSCIVGWGRLWEWPLVMVVVYNSIIWDHCSCIVGWGRLWKWPLVMVVIYIVSCGTTVVV